MNNSAAAVSTQKTYRQGQILKLITGEPIASQDELRRRLQHMKLSVTQATLSRDLREMQLVKTAAGYKPMAAPSIEAGPLSALARALSEFLSDIRPAGNLLVLKTPPGGAQPLAAAVDSERFPEVAGTIAGDDTVLIIASTPRQRAAVQKRIEELLR
jgi:transcriptional regulator of arginine metabolism